MDHWTVSPGLRFQSPSHRGSPLYDAVQKKTDIVILLSFSPLRIGAHPSTQVKQELVNCDKPLRFSPLRIGAHPSTRWWSGSPSKAPKRCFSPLRIGAHPSTRREEEMNPEAKCGFSPLRIGAHPSTYVEPFTISFRKGAFQSPSHRGSPLYGCYEIKIQRLCRLPFQSPSHRGSPLYTHTGDKNMKTIIFGFSPLRIGAHPSTAGKAEKGLWGTTFQSPSHRGAPLYLSS